MTHRIETIEQLEARYGQVNHVSLEKETPVMNDAYRRLFQACPFATLATLGPDGMDCSPRGDAPGFIQILDDTTLAIADRRGNNRLDTLRNIVQDGRIALLCMIPGWNETFRVNGTAHLSTDPELLERMAVKGKAPACAIIIRIQTMYFQCARAVKRANLWDVDTQVDPKSLPSAGELTRSVVETFDAGDYDAKLQDRQAATLY